MPDPAETYLNLVMSHVRLAPGDEARVRAELCEHLHALAHNWLGTVKSMDDAARVLTIGRNDAEDLRVRREGVIGRVVLNTR